MAPAVLWFRRDLRLADNLALVAAAQGGGPDGVVPVFVVDPALWVPSGGPRQAFLVSCLDALDRDLGGTLLVRHGDPLRRAAFTKLLRWAQDIGPVREDALADVGRSGAQRVTRHT